MDKKNQSTNLSPAREKKQSTKPSLTREKKKQSLSQSPNREKIKKSPKRRSNIENHSVTDVFDRFKGSFTSSLLSILRSIFSCSDSGVRCADDPNTDYSDASNRSGSSPPIKTNGLTHRRSSKSSMPSMPSNLELVSQKQEFPLPAISDKSVVLSESLRGSLCRYLPTLVQGRDWVLLYSTWKHGISLLTLYRRSCHLSGPCLLAVEDNQGTKFGGLLLSPLNPTTKPKFQGTNDSFVFTNSSAEFSLFRPTGMNRFYFLCTKEMLAIGGGHGFALVLESDLLSGTSQYSETFGNCCLAHSMEFKIRHVELWGFAHTSRYVPERASFKVPVEGPGFADGNLC